MGPTAEMTFGPPTGLSLNPTVSPMTSHAKPRVTPVLLTLLIFAGLAGCGDDDEVATSTTSTTTGSTTTASATTASTTTEGPDSIVVAFVCGNGETGSTDVPTGDIEQIDDIVNTIDLCEFREGLAEISFTAPCPDGDREVTVPATDGALPDIATLDLCENT